MGKLYLYSGIRFEGLKVGDLLPRSEGTQASVTRDSVNRSRMRAWFCDHKQTTPYLFYSYWLGAGSRAASKGLCCVSCGTITRIDRCDLS